MERELEERKRRNRKEGDDRLRGTIEVKVHVRAAEWPSPTKGGVGVFGVFLIYRFWLFLVVFRPDQMYWVPPALVISSSAQAVFFFFFVCSTPTQPPLFNTSRLPNALNTPHAGFALDGTEG